MRIQSYILTIAVSLIGAAQLSAQTGTYYTIRDFQTWSSATLAYKLNKKVKFGIGQELRLENNTSEVDKYFTEGFLKYKIAKPFTIGAELRFVRSNDNEGKIHGYENHLRHALNAQFKHDVNRFELKYRLQYQSSKEIGETASLGDDPTKKWRLKVGGAYNIKKWKFDQKFLEKYLEQWEPMESLVNLGELLALVTKQKKQVQLACFLEWKKN